MDITQNAPDSRVSIHQSPQALQSPNEEPNLFAMGSSELVQVHQTSYAPTRVMSPNMEEQTSRELQRLDLTLARPDDRIAVLQSSDVVPCQQCGRSAGRTM